MENRNLINEKEGKILEYKSFLYATDYVVIRNQETGQTIPEDIKEERSLARAAINALELELNALSNQPVEDNQVDLV